MPHFFSGPSSLFRVRLIQLFGGGLLVSIYPGSAAHGAFGRFVECGVGFFVGVEAAVVAHVCLRGIGLLYAPNGIRDEKGPENGGGCYRFWGCFNHDALLL